MKCQVSFPENAILRAVILFFNNFPFISENAFIGQDVLFNKDFNIFNRHSKVFQPSFQHSIENFGFTICIYWDTSGNNNPKQADKGTLLSAQPKAVFSYKERTNKMCIKGVNKRVIEVIGTDNAYFEKAVLYIRPECTALTDSRLTEEAKAYAAVLSENSSAKERLYARRKKIIYMVCISVTALCLIISGAIYLALII